MKCVKPSEYLICKNAYPSIHVQRDTAFNPNLSTCLCTCIYVCIKAKVNIHRHVGGTAGYICSCKWTCEVVFDFVAHFNVCNKIF